MSDTVQLVRPAAHDVPRRHLIGISDLDADGVDRILATAQTIARSLDREVKKLPALRGRLDRNAEPQGR